ncbi:hypothetical protein MLD38_020870 [Melastoma candidum]|uniref:Uncharacterized protein n=1 Tax=Melastoma candidum TaxID=119954 RepID=A0ACB9QEL3_9MYRT|nr:hypothetical protein MLD38_020870 [Melastoma candidum]
MSNMRSIRLSFVAALLLLAAMQSVHITEAVTWECAFSCFTGCIGADIPMYPLCVFGCLIVSCKYQPPIPPALEHADHPQTIISDPRLQCKIGCVMVKCMSARNRSSKDKKSQKCINSCAVGCHSPIKKN